MKTLSITFFTAIAILLISIYLDWYYIKLCSLLLAMLSMTIISCIEVYNKDKNKNNERFN